MNNNSSYALHDLNQQAIRHKVTWIWAMSEEVNRWTRGTCLVKAVQCNNSVFIITVEGDLKGTSQLYNIQKSIEVTHASGLKSHFKVKRVWTHLIYSYLQVVEGILKFSKSWISLTYFNELIFKYTSYIVSAIEF